MGDHIVSDTDLLKYPIGKFSMLQTFGKKELNRAIATISQFPLKLTTEVVDLDVPSLAWRYRPGGWNISEVVHHCVDSHLNAFMRFKKALTEKEPQISGYIESEWSKLSDNQQLPIQNALDILTPLHFRWAFLLQSLTAKELERGYYHLEQQRVVKLAEAIFHYEWHCNHHLAHVLSAKKNNF